MQLENKVYKAALYMRLSKDDDGVKESGSIGTQRKMLRSYANENGFTIHDEYIDDGYSGTNFERPDFKRMICDIENGYVNMVITKDLSRLGRDYITTGQYTEIFFPEHHVRYIAINDGYDSLNQYNDIAPFKHVINEMYARDASKKIRSAFQTKMKEGSYIGNFAPYGYQKDPSNKNHLIIDYNVSPVVQEIFDMAMKGAKPGEIAACLNSRDIMTPAVYRCFLRPYLNIDNYSKRREWTSGAVCKMLKNIVYLGHTAQGKSNKISFKSRVTFSTPRDDWYIVENTHDPIIDHETFEMVQKRVVSRKNSSKTEFINIFSGIAKCADCGKNMSTTGTSRRGGVYNLVCGGYKLYGKKECTNHFINYETLYNIVLTELKKQLRLTVEQQQTIAEELQNEIHEVCQKKDKNNYSANIERRIKEIDHAVQKLYEDNLTGKITDERFAMLSSAYESEYRDAKSKLELIKKHKSETGIVRKNEKILFVIINDIIGLSKLTPEIVSKFIERIEVGQGVYEGAQLKQSIKIIYKFIDYIK